MSELASQSRLPTKVRLGYGIGDMGFNLYFMTASLYLLLYYTDVLGLSPSTGGWIFSAVLVWDAITDPLMGFVASRTQTKWGKYRPYLLFGAIPLACAWILLFIPTGFTGVALTIYALSVHLVFRTLYTVVSMPYVSLSAVMTSSSHERGVLASFRMVSATGGGLLIAFFTLDLVEWFGQGDQAKGFLYVAILFSIISTLIFWVAFATTSETVSSAKAQKVSLSEAFRMLKVNSAFWLVCGMLLMNGMAWTFFNKSIPYFFKYTVERPDLIGTALAAITGCAMISIPVWTYIMKRTSKRLVAMSGSCLAIVAYILFSLMPLSNTTALLSSLVVVGFATGAGYLTFWAMMPDTVEFAEWRSGVRAEGVIFGYVSFMQKAGMALGVGLLGESLSGIGYVANQPQTPETLSYLSSMMLIAPVCFVTAALCFAYFYPLSHEKHARLVNAIRYRKNKTSNKQSNLNHK
ncbi:sugar transporter (plasmid) [Alteromonas sp. I4]|nr:sugar transporter [Alteromonas sp. I4]